MPKKILLRVLASLGLVAGGVWLAFGPEWDDRLPRIVAGLPARAPATTVPEEPVRRGLELARLRRLAFETAGKGRADRGEYRDSTDVFPVETLRSGDWRHAHPVALTVAPYRDLRLKFYQVGVKTSGRHLTWIGRNPEMPGASLVGVATPDGYDAVLLVPGASQFSFHVRNGRVLVEESLATGGDCGVGMGPGDGVESKATSGIHYAELASTPGGGAGENFTTPKSIDAPPLNVDVLFVYSTNAFAEAASRSGDPVGYLDGYTRAALETCNLVLQQSRVTAFTWRYAGLVAAPGYPAKNNVGAELDVISAGGPLESFVRAQRAQYGADQVMMWIGPGLRKGAAYVGDLRQTPAPPEATLAVLRLTAPVLVMAHELAHNFGCYHDREHAGTGDGSTAAPEGDGNWSYGLLWNEPAGNGIPASTAGTVMSYGDFLVPYFSNPNITLTVTSTLEGRDGPTRNLGTRTIGFVETDPRAAFNARLLNESAAQIAAVSPETETMPAILQQPQDNVLSAGQMLALSVSATGGGLSYQWFRGGTTIDGATAATLTKTFVAADAGSYTVQVSNRVGTTTSRAATITVAGSSTPTPPATQPAAASGGGGGGAASLWFYAVLLVLYWARSARRRADH